MDIYRESYRVDWTSDAWLGAVVAIGIDYWKMLRTGNDDKAVVQRMTMLAVLAPEFLDFRLDSAPRLASEAGKTKKSDDREATLKLFGLTCSLAIIQRALTDGTQPSLVLVTPKRLTLLAHLTGVERYRLGTIQIHEGRWYKRMKKWAIPRSVEEYRATISKS